MIQKKWDKWVLQTATTWEDVAPIIKETGIFKIDYDHKILIEYIIELNNFLLLMDRGFNLEIVNAQKDLLKRFIKYTELHFKREEDILIKYKIKGLDRQKDQHKDILKMLKSIIFEFDTGRISSAFKLRLEILNWVIRHINETDYNVFKFENISGALLKINNWQEISGFIRSTGIPSIDFEHKKLTEATIETGLSIENLEKGNSLSIVIENLKSLLEIVIMHFENEENIILKYSIPGIELQKGEHLEFINYLKKEMALLKEKNTKNITELKKKLLFWWIQHININDYNTFKNSDCYYHIFNNAQNEEDVGWLVSPTGYDVIDKDHQHFISLLFKSKSLIITESESSKKSAESIKELKVLYDYAKKHFSSEEEIMKNDYPESIERHALEHKKILKMIEEYMFNLEKGILDCSLNLAKTFLSLWIGHTNGMDFETFGASYCD